MDGRYGGSSGRNKTTSKVWILGKKKRECLVLCCVIIFISSRTTNWQFVNNLYVPARNDRSMMITWYGQVSALGSYTHLTCAHQYKHYKPQEGARQCIEIVTKTI